MLKRTARTCHSAFSAYDIFPNQQQKLINPFHAFPKIGPARLRSTIKCGISCDIDGVVVSVNWLEKN